MKPMAARHGKGRRQGCLTRYNKLMSQATSTIIRRAIWAVFIPVCAYYLYRAIRYRFLTPDALGPTFWNKQVWYSAHLGVALIPLLLGPLQFSHSLRQRYPLWHRRLGKCYLIGSALTALTALYLGATQSSEGSIVPVMLLATLWLLFIAGAFLTAKRRNFVTHRLFAIRSYTCAMVFVSLRVLGDVGYGTLFPFIESEAIRETTHEWISDFLPLLVVEALIAWIPSISRKTVSPPQGN